MRLCKNAKLIGLQGKPFTEEELVFMLTDGRIVGWRLFDSDGPADFLSEVGCGVARGNTSGVAR